MLTRLCVIAGFGAMIGAVWACCMRAIPRRGAMRALERLCAGVVLFYLLSAVLAPFGVRLAQGPLAAAASGLWGLPGAALAAFAQLLP